jgi:hypothetical protein
MAKELNLKEITEHNNCYYRLIMKIPAEFLVCNLLVKVYTKTRNFS